nr:S-adenosylmethionine-dependent methyltransferase [Cryptococcus depauperatus CBS 7855]
MASRSVEDGELRMSVAERWLKPNGPPVGSTFGARLLKDDDDVFDHNAWDHAVLPKGFRERAEQVMELHRSNPVAEDVRDKYNDQPANYWDKFYSTHEDGFFKDRGWLRLEFPELIACSEAEAGPKTVLEVGCGAGNTVFPLLMRNENPSLTIYATDYSATAINVVKANKMYPRAEHGKGVIHASVWDITSKPLASSSTTTKHSSKEHSPTYSLPDGILPGTVDVISVIFVLSALHPREWEQTIHNLYTALAPGGLLLIRDYGRHDLAQLRIKKNRLLDPDTPNLYIRGDGTRVYFFEKEELEDMLVQSPLGSTEIQEQGKKMFAIEQLGEDRRLLVNRKERLTMYRIWMQVKARKLS